MTSGKLKNQIENDKFFGGYFNDFTEINFIENYVALSSSFYSIESFWSVLLICLYGPNPTSYTKLENPNLISKAKSSCCKSTFLRFKNLFDFIGFSTTTDYYFC